MKPQKAVAKLLGLKFVYFFGLEQNETSHPSG